MTTPPTVTAVRMTGAPDRADLPLLVLGPALGTSADSLWRRCARGLVEAFDVLAFDLPGHGHNRSVPDRPMDAGDVARGVLTVVDDVQAQRGDAGAGFWYAGDSIGGAIGLQLLLDAPDRVLGATLCCTGAIIGEASAWAERADQVRTSGTASLVEASVTRWFAPGFLERDPETASALLHTLREVDDTGYARGCELLAGFDVRERLGEIAAPVLAVAGADDGPTPPSGLRAIADGVQQGRYVELAGVGHLAPAEAPDEVARLIVEMAHGGAPSDSAGLEGLEGLEGLDPAGLAVRRAVLGDDHVDRSIANTTDFTRPFQEFITAGAWGSVWTRPGLDRRSRSLITLTALVAGGHHEELALHVRAALRNGLTVAEIQECLLQTAVYCGVPAANTAFRIAAEVLAEG